MDCIPWVMISILYSPRYDGGICEYRRGLKGTGTSSKSSGLNSISPEGDGRENGDTDLFSDCLDAGDCGIEMSSSSR